MAWYDDLYDGASNLVSKASANELFGVNESGLFNDIGLIDDLKESALGRALRGVDANTSGAGVNEDGKPMYGSSDYMPEVEAKELEPFQSTDYQMNMPAKMEMQYGGPQKSRNPDRNRVGGPPVETYGRQRLQLNANTEEEEERARLAQYLRNIG